MNPTLYNDIWQQLLDTERCYRYHNELAARYRKWQLIPRGIMAVSSVVGVILVFTEKVGWFPDFDFLYVPIFLSIIAAVVWDFMHDYGEKAAILNSISVECAELETELKDLWRSVYAEPPTEESQIKSRLKKIEITMGRVTQRAVYAGILVDEDLNEKSQKEGFEVISDRYAGQEIKTT